MAKSYNLTKCGYPQQITPVIKVVKKSKIVNVSCPAGTIVTIYKLYYNPPAEIIEVTERNIIFKTGKEYAKYIDKRIIGISKRFRVDGLIDAGLIEVGDNLYLKFQRGL